MVFDIPYWLYLTKKMLRPPIFRLLVIQPSQNKRGFRDSFVVRNEENQRLPTVVGNRKKLSCRRSEVRDGGSSVPIEGRETYKQRFRERGKFLSSAIKNVGLGPVEVELN